MDINETARLVIFLKICTPILLRFNDVSKKTGKCNGVFILYE